MQKDHLPSKVLLNRVILRMRQTLPICAVSLCFCYAAVAADSVLEKGDTQSAKRATETKPDKPAAEAKPEKASKTKSDLVWESYTPQSGEFTVDIPGAVTIRQRKTDGLPATLYECTTNKLSFIISCNMLEDDPDAFTKYTTGVINSMQDKEPDHAESPATLAVTGKGWSGTSVSFSEFGLAARSALITKVDKANIAYTLALNTPRDSEETKRFFGSFVVDPDKATKAHAHDEVPISFEIYKTVLYLGIPTALLIWFLVIAARTKKK